MSTCPPSHEGSFRRNDPRGCARRLSRSRTVSVLVVIPLPPCGDLGIRRRMPWPSTVHCLYQAQPRAAHPNMNARMGLRLRRRGAATGHDPWCQPAESEGGYHRGVLEDKNHISCCWLRWWASMCDRATPVGSGIFVLHREPAPGTSWVTWFVPANSPTSEDVSLLGIAPACSTPARRTRLTPAPSLVPRTSSLSCRDPTVNFTRVRKRFAIVFRMSLGMVYMPCLDLMEPQHLWRRGCRPGWRGTETSWNDVMSIVSPGIYGQWLFHTSHGTAP